MQGSFLKEAGDTGCGGISVEFEKNRVKFLNSWRAALMFSRGAEELLGTFLKICTRGAVILGAEEGHFQCA